MAASAILRDRQTRVRFFCQNTVGLILLMLAVVSAGGCWIDIPYDPAVEEQAALDRGRTEEARVAQPDESETGSAFAVTDEVEPTLVVDIEQPTEDATIDKDADLFGEEIAVLALGIQPAEESEPPTEIASTSIVDEPVPDAEGAVPLVPTAEDGLFGNMLDEESSQEETHAPDETSTDTSAPLLPWEVDSSSPLEVPGDEDRPSALGPIQLPGEQPEPKVAESESSRAVVEGPDSDEWKSARSATKARLDSRQLTWRLSSALSYALIAPNVDIETFSAELESLAKALGIELPAMESNANMSAGDRARQLLAVGRALGKAIADKYGADHAALVEVAFKSHLLLVVVEARPHLKESINNSVVAAAVRAGLPDSVWQPWQSRIAETDIPSNIANAVVDLRARLDAYLDERAATDDSNMPPMLR